MNRTQAILAVLLDGQPRTIEQIVAALPALDHAQTLATLSGLLKGSRVVATHTYQVTDVGRASVARPPITKAQRQAEWREAKKRQKERKAEDLAKHAAELEAKRVKRSAIAEAATLARVADGIVIGAIRNPHPLHAAWGGARQGAGA